MPAFPCPFALDSVVILILNKTEMCGIKHSLRGIKSLNRFGEDMCNLGISSTPKKIPGSIE